MIQIFKIEPNKRAITLIEIVIACALFAILMLAAYRLFFAEIKSIKTALEHVGVNENARSFFAYFGNDVRSANWVDFPEQKNIEVVKVLTPINEGKVCQLTRQVFDFKIKPPNPAFIKTEQITYFLKKQKDGTSDLYREVDSNIPVRGNSRGRKKFKRRICNGIKNILLFTTNRKPVNIQNFSAMHPFKSLITYQPYTLNGKGPYLVYVKVTFVRKGRKNSKLEQVYQLKTCFCVRGRLNGVHP